MENDISISFKFIGENLDPEKITSLTKLKPSKMWHKGDLRLRTIIKEDESGWELKASKEKTVSEQINELLDMLRPIKNIIVDISTKYYTELSCYIDCYSSCPEISFTSSVIKELAEMNVNLDIDIYNLK